MEFIADLVLFVQFLLELGFLVLVLDLNLIQLLALLVLNLAHFEHLAGDAMVDVGLLLLEFFGL